MSKTVTQYPSNDRNSVYGAAQEAVRDLSYKVTYSDFAGGVISCRSGMSWKSFGQTITILVTSSGSAGSELSLTTQSGQAYDWGEGKQIIARLQASVQSHLQGKSTADSTPKNLGDALGAKGVKKLAAESEAQTLAIKEAHVHSQKASRSSLGLTGVGFVIAGMLFMAIIENVDVGLWISGGGVLMLAGWLIWGSFMPKQCPKCSKHAVNCLSSIDRIIGVRSVQRLQANRVSGNNESVQVVVSDIEQINSYRCTLCRHQWEEIRRFTRDGS